MLLGRGQVFVGVQVQVDDLVAAYLARAHAVMKQSHWTGDFPVAVVDVQLLALFVVAVDIAAHAVRLNVQFLLLSVIWVSLITQKSLLMIVCCIPHRDLLKLCILHVYLRWWLEGVRLLVVLLRERLLLLLAFVHRYRYGFIRWRANAIVQYLGVCASVLVECFLNFAGGKLRTVLMLCGLR